MMECRGNRGQPVARELYGSQAEALVGCLSLFITQTCQRGGSQLCQDTSYLCEKGDFPP